MLGTPSDCKHHAATAKHRDYEGHLTRRGSTELRNAWESSKIMENRGTLSGAATCLKARIGHRIGSDRKWVCECEGGLCCDCAVTAVTVLSCMNRAQHRIASIPIRMQSALAVKKARQPAYGERRGAEKTPDTVQQNQAQVKSTRLAPGGGAAAARRFATGGRPAGYSSVIRHN